jgi:hypothetical protein
MATLTRESLGGRSNQLTNRPRHDESDDEFDHAGRFGGNGPTRWGSSRVAYQTSGRPLGRPFSSTRLPQPLRRQILGYRDYEYDEDALVVYITFVSGNAYDRVPPDVSLCGGEAATAAMVSGWSGERSACGQRLRAPGSVA